MNRKYSLRRNKDFQYVYRRGSRYGCKLMALICIKSGKSIHVGFSIGKKVGNSVIRNRTKRRMKESFRHMLPNVRAGYRLIFVARESAAAASYSEIYSSMQNLLKKASLLEAVYEGQRDRNGQT